MMDGDRCAETRELAAELAFGIADGEDRARVLEHSATCPRCQRELEQVSALADELLVMAPQQEPPLGFELRAMRAVRPQQRRPSWTLRPLAVVAAALAAAAITAGALLFSFRDDRQLADEYRATLSEAHGSYFGAVRLRDAAGARAGVVFTYAGSPSWIMVTVDGPHRRSVRHAMLVTSDRARVPLHSFRLRDGTWGGRLPIGLDSLAAVHLLDGNGRSMLVAYVRPRW